MLKLMPGEGRVLRTARIIAFVDQASPSLLEFLTREHGYDLVDQVRELYLAGKTPSVALVDLAEERVLLCGPWSVDHDPATPADMVQTLTLDTTAEIALLFTAEARPLADTYLSLGHVPAGGFVYRPDPAVDHRVTIAWVATSEVAVTPEVAVTTAVAVTPEAPGVAPLVAPTESTTPAASDPFESEIFDDPGLDLAALGRGEVRTTGPLTDQQPTQRDQSPEPIVGPDREPPAKVINLTDPPAGPPSWQFREPPSARTTGTDHSEPAAATTTSPAPSQQSFREPHAHDSPTPTPTSDVTSPATEADQPVASGQRLAVIDFGDFGSRTVGYGIVIGRNPTRISLDPGFETIVVRDAEVSRAHAKIWISGSELVVQDLGSANGSILHRMVGSRHDVPTEPDALTMLVGDELTIGSQRIRFVGWNLDG